MKDEIAPGDIVKIKSGGPLMTVTNVSVKTEDAGILVSCEWFDNRKAEKAVFNAMSLEKAEVTEKKQTPSKRVRKIIKH